MLRPDVHDFTLTCQLLSSWMALGVTGSDTQGLKMIADETQPRFYLSNERKYAVVTKSQ